MASRVRCNDKVELASRYPDIYTLLTCSSGLVSLNMVALMTGSRSLVCILALIVDAGWIEVNEITVVEDEKGSWRAKFG